MTSAIKELLGRLRDLEAKATPGPWESIGGSQDGSIYVMIRKKYEALGVEKTDYPDATEIDEALIREIRNALPVILAEFGKLDLAIHEALSELPAIDSNTPGWAANVWTILKNTGHEGVPWLQVELDLFKKENQELRKKLKQHRP